MNPNRNPLDLADRALSVVERAMLWVAGVMIVILMVLGVGEVVARSVFNRPIVGYIDVVGLFTSAIAFLALAYCQGVGKHIRMELVVSSLRGRAHWAAELVGVLMALAVVTLLLDPTWQHAMRSIRLGDSTMDIRLPMWPSKLLVPVALGLLWLRLALNALGYLRLVIWPEATPLAVPRPGRLVEDGVEEIGRPG